MEDKKEIQLKKSLDVILKRQFPAIAEIQIKPRRKNKYNIMLGTAHLTSDFEYYVNLYMKGSDWKRYLVGADDLDDSSKDQIDLDWQSIMKTVNLIVKLIGLGKNDYIVIFNSVED